MGKLFAGGAPMTALEPMPETEVKAKATRRRFTAQEKLRVLRLVDACTQRGEIGALLRREGIYSSSLQKWRAERDAGALEAMTKKRRGPKPHVPSAAEKEYVELKRALAKAEARAKHAEALVELQKKVAELLGHQLPKSEES